MVCHYWFYLQAIHAILLFEDINSFVFLKKERELFLSETPGGGKNSGSWNIHALEYDHLKIYIYMKNKQPLFVNLRINVPIEP